MQPLDYCQQKAAASQSSFLAGFRFLPLDKRHALTVLYAFCRELDDIVDDCSDIGVAETTLRWWRNDLAKVFAEKEIPEHPVNQALCQIVVSFALPEVEFVAIIEGMQMDLMPVRYPHFEALNLYCHRVAEVVGQLIARILGFSNPQTLEYADKLGLALQLTNIIRDVGEDARMGRIYLPIDELQHFGVTAQSILHLQATAEFSRLMAFQIERAESIYAEAVALLPREDAKAQKVGLIMASIYYALLQEIKRDGVENVLRYKIGIPSPRKKRLALKAWLFGFKPKK